MSNSKILVIGASNNEQSINKLWALWLAQYLSFSPQIIDLNDYEMPIYSIQREQNEGIPALAKELYNTIGASELIFISLAEYNGSYTSAFKNILDWMSRIDIKVFQNKKCILSAVSPSRTGGFQVLHQAVERFPIMGAQVVASFHLPSYHHTFDIQKGILDKDLMNDFEQFIAEIKAKLD